MIITYSLPQRAPERFETRSNDVILGRSPANGNRLDLDLMADLYVSHAHARLTCEDDGYWIEDLGSINGTWIDGEMIAEKTQLGPETEIKVGWTRIQVHMAPIPHIPGLTPGLDAPTRVRQEPGESATAISGGPDAGAEDLPTRITGGADAGGKPDPAVADADPFPGQMDDGVATVITDPLPEEIGPVDIEAELEGLDHGFGPADAKMAETVAGSVAPPAAGRPPGLFSTDMTRTADSVEPTIIAAAPSLPVAPPEEDDTLGDIIHITDATANRFHGRETVSAEDILTLAWRQLKAFNELGNTLDAALSLNELVNILAGRMPGVIPNAQRGAVLMPDDRGGLLLKAHWPAGEHSVSMTWVHRAFEMREAFIWALPEDQCVGSDMPSSAVYYRVQSAIYAPLMIGEKVLGVIYVDNYLTRQAFSSTDFELLKAVANHVAIFIRDRLLCQERQQEKELQANLQRQFSPGIAARIVDRAGRLQLGGERVNPVTILVSDVRTFTAMSAKMPPHEVVRMLNEMFDAFVPIIFEFGGVVDKYVGDSVLAVFGSPEPDDRQWEKALRAAMEMQQAVRMLGEGRRVRRLPVFEVGISLHSGEAIHGFIGSGQRMEYTVIGDTVNQASRLCDGAGAGEVVISQSVYERVYRMAEVRPKTIRTKHSDTEPDLQAYVVTRLQ